MKAIPTLAPTNLAALDDADPNAGGAHHCYAVQYGGPKDLCVIQFQHGPRGVAGSTAGVFDDDLLAIIEDRLSDFQAGPYFCEENAEALEHIQAARAALGGRVAARMNKGVLGLNEKH